MSLKNKIILDINKEQLIIILNDLTKKYEQEIDSSKNNLEYLNIFGSISSSNVQLRTKALGGISARLAQLNSNEKGVPIAQQVLNDLDLIDSSSDTVELQVDRSSIIYILEDAIKFYEDEIELNKYRIEKYMIVIDRDIKSKNKSDLYYLEVLEKAKDEILNCQQMINLIKELFISMGYCY